MSSTNRNGNRPRKDGNYATPIWSVKAVLPYLPIAKRILDPCAGAGNILSAISVFYGDRVAIDSLAGIEMNATKAKACLEIPNVTDCVCANALLSTTVWNNPDLIVMNPPFSLAEIFIRRALNEVATLGTVAVLLRIAYAAGKKRESFWKDKVADMAVLARRPSFEKIGTSTHDSADYAWFIFGPYSIGRWYRLEVEESEDARQGRLEAIYGPQLPEIVNIT